MAAKVRVTLIKSPFGRKPKQRRTLEALGIRRTGASKLFADGPAFRGMVAVVAHLVRLDAA